MAVREFVQIERQVVLFDVIKAAHDATLEQAPERLDVIGMDLTAHVFALTVAASCGSPRWLNG